MKGIENSAYLILLLISNLLALGILAAAWKSARLGRLLFFLLFLWAGITNWLTALHNPNTYLGEADLVEIGVYRQFILGWFSRHILLMVGFIASCQLLIAFSMLGKGWIVKWGGIAAILFLLAIVPFGVGSGFPSTLIAALAMYLLIRQPYKDYIWKKQSDE
ncbi:MAG: hypothetical protein GC171_11030 [Terrimonas sp.]|nr:hypothetical protein [Terrimonas sp.]